MSGKIINVAREFIINFGRNYDGVDKKLYAVPDLVQLPSC